MCAVLGVVAVGVSVVSWWSRVATDTVHSTPVRVPERDGDPVVPAVVWPRGLPDHGRWENDPWVASLREFHLVHAAAYNSGRLNGRADLLEALDDSVFRALLTVDELQGDLLDEWEGALLAGEEVPIMPGPMPFEVVDVLVSRSGDLVEVNVCANGNFESWSSAEPFESLMSRDQGRSATWTLVRGNDGRIRVRESSWDFTQSDRVISDVHFGLFDPPPARPTEVPAVERWQPGAGLRSGASSG